MNISENETSVESREYIFDRPDVRIIFISLYTFVFCGCFFGNLLVVLVIIFSRRLRSVTNFFLGNLAIADLCVGIFCVYQNLSIYLITSWIFGDFMCKMYQFIQSMSYTASIFILVAICGERYFSILHPMTCKRVLSSFRVKLLMLGVWLVSALYSSPKFIWVQTITNYLGNNQTETICISHRRKYNSELFDMINFCLLYLLPLLTMTILYSRIAVSLWQGTTLLIDMQSTKGQSYTNEDNFSNKSTQRYSSDHQKVEKASQTVPTVMRELRKGHMVQLQSRQSENVLRARRTVIKMLVIVVLTFAVCNLPIHARKMWQYWSPNYNAGSVFSTLFTPLTFLTSYINSAIHPLLYTFFNRNFRRGVQVLLFCNNNVDHRRSYGTESSLSKWPPSCNSSRSAKMQICSVSYPASSEHGNCCQ